MPDKHAVLSASSAYRWLNCPASVRLTENMPDTAGEAAAEGTLAHAICELKLRKQFIEPMGPRKYSAALKKLQADPVYSAEMLEGQEMYFDFVNSLFLERKTRPYISVEQTVDYSSYAPEGFGTADCVIIGGGILDVIDYKYGKGVPVDAEDNPQLKLYALGALARYGPFYAVDTVRLHIVQPRMGGVKSWETTRGAVEEWGESIKPIAVSAYNGTGPCVCGEWCDKGFCKLRATCRVRNEALLYSDFTGMVDKIPPELSPEEVGHALTYAKRVKTWLSDLEEYALAAVLRGEHIEGWKAVEGKSSRTIKDTDKAFAAIVASGTDEALLYERKPLTLTALEKLLGAKRLTEIIGKYIEKPRGKPALVPESDTRPEYNSIKADFDNKEENTEE